MVISQDASNRQPQALVTGGTGFIGSHLVRYLQREGWSVHLLVHSKRPDVAGVQLHGYEGNIAGLVRVLDRSRPDVVFHLASLFLAQHDATQVSPLIQANILLGAQLLDAMHSAGVRAFVNTGTAWQHFGQNAYRPVNLYAATKQAFEDILAYYCDIGAIDAITLKLFDSYGPRDNRKKLLSLLLSSLKTGAELQLSGGQQMIDLVHVDDLCRAFLQAALLVRSSPKQPACTSYALSGGERHSLREIVVLIEELAGRSLPVRWGAKPYRPREVMHLWDGLALPGWQRHITLAEGFKALLHEEESTASSPQEA